MYYPYFRGKQFELMALRECAQVLADSSFIPIIEPVRESLSGLERALAAIGDAGGQAIVIANPRYGDHKSNDDNIRAFLENYRGNDEIFVGTLLLSRESAKDAIARVQSYSDRPQAIIHAGFTEARVLADSLVDRMREVTNVFVEGQTNMLYRRHFIESKRVLVRDGFEQKKNADYDPVDSYSDLHATYTDMGMQGYGDFLTIGDRYSEGGGPAYAVAIHLTYIDEGKDEAMFVYHFVSDSNDTPTDPAGKFNQALTKLILRLDSGNSGLLETTAIQEFRRLYAAQHFPGLGYVKKLSIRHHVETLADYHRSSHA